MSSSISRINDIARRVIELSSSYSSNKAFILECDINNRSLITDLKTGRIKNVSGADLSQIVRGTSCSGTWLLTGQGEMFPRERPRANPAEGEHSVYARRLMQLIRLLKSLEMNKEDLQGLELPANVSLKAARLTALLLEAQQGVESDSDS